MEERKPHKKLIVGQKSFWPAPLLTFSPLLLLAFSTAFAAPGETSFDFLRLPSSARQAGMGGTGIALNDETTSLQQNPASLSELKSQLASFSYNLLFDNAVYGDIGYSRPTSRYGNLGLSFRDLDYGQINGYDATGTPQGSVPASSRLLSMGWAPRRDGLVPGASLKIAQESLDNITATAFALDAGANYHPPIDPDDTTWLGRQSSHLTFGAMIQNLGPNTKFENEREKLPLTYGLGVAYRGFADTVRVAIDLDHQAAADQIVQLKLGAEAWFQDVLAIRFGYTANQGIGTGLHMGFGIKAGSLQMDYAFSPLSDLGNVHSFTLSFRFGRNLVDQYYEQGLRQMRLGNYAESVLYFDKALEIEPKNARILESALEAAHALEKGEKQGTTSPSLRPKTDEKAP